MAKRVLATIPSSIAGIMLVFVACLLWLVRVLNSLTLDDRAGVDNLLNWLNLSRIPLLLLVVGVLPSNIWWLRWVLTSLSLVPLVATGTGIAYPLNWLSDIAGLSRVARLPGVGLLVVELGWASPGCPSKIRSNLSIATRNVPTPRRCGARSRRVSASWWLRASGMITFGFHDVPWLCYSHRQSQDDGEKKSHLDKSNLLGKLNFAGMLRWSSSPSCAFVLAKYFSARKTIYSSFQNYHQGCEHKQK